MPAAAGLAFLMLIAVFMNVIASFGTSHGVAMLNMSRACLALMFVGVHGWYALHPEQLVWWGQATKSLGYISIPVAWIIPPFISFWRRRRIQRSSP